MLLRQKERMQDHHSEPATPFLNDSLTTALLKDYSQASARLLLLDYDGSLVPFTSHPSLARPGEEILQTLSKITSYALNDVFIISGRDGATLESWFNGLPVGLIAEHGAVVRKKSGDWITTQENTPLWKPEIAQLMQQAVESCSGSFVEEKQFSLAWHYRNAASNAGPTVAEQLFARLQTAGNKAGLNILQGNKVIEVRIEGIDKGAATQKLLDVKRYDFILAVGDDRTDEDMFRQLLNVPQAYSVKVGNDPSLAKYHLAGFEQVGSLLGAMAQHIR